MVKKALLKNRLDILKKVGKYNKKDRREYMKFCPDDCIHAISECCHNILNNTFKFTKKEKTGVERKLLPVVKDIKKLSNPTIPVKNKRKILSKPQVGDGLFGIIAQLVIPALASLFGK